MTAVKENNVSAKTALEQMIGVDDIATDRHGREDCRWVICFHTVDTRGRQIGHNQIMAGMPARIRSRNYPLRNDDISKPIDEDVPPMTTSRVPAGPAAENLHADYGERGLRIIECLTGRETREDAILVSDLMAAVLPDLMTFDGEADSEWNAWSRRAAWLSARLAEYDEGSVEHQFVSTLIESNAVGRQYEADYFSKLEQEATNRRAHGVSAGGRTNLKGGEESRLARLGKKPSSAFDGYEASPAPAGMPVGMVELMQQQNEILKATLGSKDETIAELKARVERLESQSGAANAKPAPSETTQTRNRDRT